MYFKELNDFLDFNATNYPTKTAFLDDNYQITWKNLKSVLVALEKKLNEDYELNDLDTTIILDGEYCVTQVLIIILGILKGWVIVPKNRTLIRSNNILVDAVEIRVNEISLYEIIKSSDKSHGKMKTFSFEKEAIYYYTSGTTGDPKVIVSSNSNLIRGGVFVSKALGLNETDILGGTLSLDFDYGINQIICTIVVGATYVAMPYSSIKKPWFEYLNNFAVTIIPTMPFLIEKYFRIPEKNFSYTNVRMITSSGAPFTELHARMSNKIFPAAKLVPMYGLSEGFRATILPPGDYEKFPNSVGLPIGNTVIKIVDETGMQCLPNQIGEIFQSSGCITWGYLNDDQSTNQRFVHDQTTPGRLWLKSGDLGYLNESGYLFVKGRVSAQIKKFGVRISIDEIESIYKNSGKFEYVLAIPLEINSTESDFALIFCTSLNEEEIQSFIRSVSREFRPKKFVITDDLLGNYNGGKPDRNKLKEKYFGDF